MVTLPHPWGLDRAKLEKFRRDLKNFNADLVLFLHEEAEEHPKGSDERLASFEFAHEIYLEGRRKRRGRPKKEEGSFDGDASTLMYMNILSRKTGETSPRRLARLAMDSVPNVGSEKSRVERLARKYTKRRDTMEWHGPGWRADSGDDDPSPGDDDPWI
jgi:hypothetical protein